MIAMCFGQAAGGGNFFAQLQQLLQLLSAYQGGQTSNWNANILGVPQSTQATAAGAVPMGAPGTPDAFTWSAGQQPAQQDQPQMQQPYQPFAPPAPAQPTQPQSNPQDSPPAQGFWGERPTGPMAQTS